MTEPLTDDQVWGCAAPSCFCDGCAFYVSVNALSGLGYCSAVATGPLEAVAANDAACDCYEPTPVGANHDSPGKDTHPDTRGANDYEAVR